MSQAESIAADLVKAARARGADIAEAVVAEGKHLDAKVRLQRPELLEEAGSRSFGLRVMLGTEGAFRSAVAYSSDASVTGLSTLVEDALELARLSEVDPFLGPPEGEPAAPPYADLKLFDASVDSIDGTFALERARAAEAAAFSYDARVQNSEGASFGRSSGLRALATSGGFCGVSTGTYASLSVHAVVDDEGGKKRSGHHWTAKRFAAGLLPAEEIGRVAAERALAKLGSRKVPTGEVAVVFDPDVARSIVGLIAGCVAGGAVWRKTSYLAAKLGESIASPLVSIVDDPTIVGAPGSRPFDGEGLRSRVNNVVDKGVLQGFLLDSYSARKMRAHDSSKDFRSTGSASRGGSGGVSSGTTNFFMLSGKDDPKSIVKDTPRGLYVTDMMGFGFNAVTGDFSRGAAGFWIENGELTFPVSEVTLSLNLHDLLHRIDRVGTDLDLKTGVAAPTFRVSAMMLAGS